MQHKVITLLLALIALFIGYAATRHNLAYKATIKLLPDNGLYANNCNSSVDKVKSNTTTATDGFMTQYEDVCFWYE